MPRGRDRDRRRRDIDGFAQSVREELDYHTEVDNMAALRDGPGQTGCASQTSTTSCAPNGSS